MTVDFGRTAADYVAHRAGFPTSFYTTLGKLGVDLNGTKLLDLGTGTGTLARGFAERGAQVTGLDPSEQMLEQARLLAADIVSPAGMGNSSGPAPEINFVNASAEHTGFADACFDLVSAGQCWHWFDRPAAAAECARILRPGGQLVIAHYDWIPLPGNLLELTETLIKQHNPDWRFDGGTGVYPWWFADMTGAGFTALDCHIYDEDAIYSHEAWRGRVRASAGVAACLDPPAVARFDADLADAMRRDFPADPLPVHHRIFVLKGRKPV